MTLNLALTRPVFNVSGIGVQCGILHGGYG